MDQKVFRYCPQCGARVQGEPAIFTSPRKCPKCSNVVMFYDYPRDGPALPTDIVDDQEPTILDYAAVVLAGGFALLCIIALLGALFGAVTFACFLAFLGFVFSVLVFGLYLNQRGTILRYSARVNSLNESLRSNSNALQEAVAKFTGFKTNFDRLVADEKLRLDTETAEHRSKTEQLLERANQRFQYAENRESVIDRLGKKLLNDSVKWISNKLTPSNYTISKDRLRKLIEFCRKHEYEVSQEQEEELLRDLKSEYEAVLRREHQKEEQARIKAQIREEQRAERELEREMQRIEAERTAIENALEKALKETHEAHSAEIDRLREMLREAEEKAQRAKSMAEMTKAGHVYVISNIGSFGEGVFKVGMTRRLEPMERVKELGDASVPFPFDVHMMISCDDAPALENAVHKALHDGRVNKVNFRKEFFRTNIETIRQLVEEQHGIVDYVAEPEALQYRETLSMSDEDYHFLESQYEAVASANGEDDDF